MNNQIIAYVLNVDVEGLIPFGLFASSLYHFSLVFLLFYLDDAIGIHLGEYIGVTDEFCFYYMKCKFFVMN